MRDRMSRALVPVMQRLPALVRSWGRQDHDPWRHSTGARATGGDGAEFDLVAQETHLRNRSQVERYLPDIMGRALARVWIDAGFRDRFGADPKATLAAYDVHLPPTIEIDFVTYGTLRPQVVVHEVQSNGQRKRLLYLKLVMMAGR